MLYRNFATIEEIDAEYDFGQIIGDLSSYFDFYSSESAKARDALNCIPDVRFGPTVEETLDIFPAGNPDAPILIFIHGGYWRRLSAKNFSFIARGLVARGITVVVTDYANSPYAYIDQDLEFSRRIARVRQWFDDSGYITFGRFGRYEYHNSDQCISHAMEAHSHIQTIARSGAPARPVFS